MATAFRLFEETDLCVLRRWFIDDELARRLSYPSADWFRYVTGPEQSRCWVGVSDDEAVVVIQVDGSAGTTGYFSIAMRPDLRGQGLGANVLAAFLKGPGRAYPQLIGSIEPSNYASLACCRRCGFTLANDLDEDGLIQATYENPDVVLQFLS